MQTPIKIKCWTCFGIGSGLIAISINAYAADGGDYGPSWEMLANGLFGLVLLIIGTYIKAYKDAIGGRLDKMDDKIKGIEEDIDVGISERAGLRLVLAQNYHSKTDIREVVASALSPIASQIANLQASTTELHRRLDGERK